MQTMMEMRLSKSSSYSWIKVSSVARSFGVVLQYRNGGCGVEEG
uniref:Uncharacterized protein n=1 Tax=Anguilla anguilla TaxID=7936 RepID=A0A0E9UUA5_ANGAN